ncbi:tetratricopeptide repeat protein [Ectothiorhodospira haloalkaliphila]|nr:tetratricopeptide repeat protein [Ectothiorhodospira haloalkaliphila]
MSRLVNREGTSQPRSARWPIECRFHWARLRNANDGMVSLIEGVHYHRLGNRAEARTHLKRAAELSPENPEVRYNVGLLLFRYGEHDAAYGHAKEAYAMGYPLPGLRNMLERAGYSLDD